MINKNFFQKGAEFFVPNNLNLLESMQLTTEKDQINQSFKREKKLVIILDGLKYPSNVGNILRSCLKSKILEKIYICCPQHLEDNEEGKLPTVLCCDKTSKYRYSSRFKSRVAHVSMAQRHKNDSNQSKFVYTTLETALEQVKSQEYVCVAMDCNASQSLFSQQTQAQLKQNKNFAFVFGNERAGLSKKAKQNCDMSLFIDTKPDADQNSILNVATAAQMVFANFLLLNAS